MDGPSTTPAPGGPSAAASAPPETASPSSIRQRRGVAVPANANPDADAGTATRPPEDDASAAAAAPAAAAVHAHAAHPQHHRRPLLLPLQQQHLVALSTAAAGLGACLSAGAVVALLVADVDRLLPLVAAVCVAALTSVLFRVALAAIAPAGNATRNRLRRATRHFTGERAAYVRTSQRLAMVDRDFTAADYEMLLDLDNNSQRLRQFLEGASQETIERLPTYVYSVPKREREGRRSTNTNTTATTNTTTTTTTTSTPTTTNTPINTIMTNAADVNPVVDGIPVVAAAAARDTVSATGGQVQQHREPEDQVAVRQPERTTSMTTLSAPSLTTGVESSRDDLATSTGQQRSSAGQQAKQMDAFPGSFEEKQYCNNPTECTGGETATQCTICLEQFDDGMVIRILPCMHQFMAQCIDPWLLQQAKCPVCKGPAVADPMEGLHAYM